MKLQLEESRGIGPAELEISDVPTARGTVSVTVDECPRMEDSIASVEIDREAATKICEHLIRVFGLLSLHPYAGETKPQTKYGVPR